MGNNQGYNAADFGVLVLNDQNGLRIGDALGGWYSFRTQGLVWNHVTMLGYSANLDNAQKMHRVDAQFFSTINPNNAVYGDDMQHGSSGGPWIENFGPRSAGQTGGIQPIHNVVVGVTSSGVGNPSAPSLLVTSSIPDNGVAQMILNACNVAPGTCQ